MFVTKYSCFYLFILSWSICLLNLLYIKQLVHINHVMIIVKVNTITIHIIFFFIFTVEVNFYFILFQILDALLFKVSSSLSKIFLHKTELAAIKVLLNALNVKSAHILHMIKTTLKRIWFFILVNVLINTNFVIKVSFKKRILNIIDLYILEKNLTHAMYVSDHLTNQVFWKDTWIHINNMKAPYV